MKVAIIVGTRPEIIKMAPIVRACAERAVPYLLLHTGQHYSYEMDGVFFEELGIPTPHANLAVRSGSQAYQIGTIIRGILPLYVREGKSYLTVAFGCTGGRHRSVAMAEQFGAILRRLGIEPTVTHRDVTK